MSDTSEYWEKFIVNPLSGNGSKNFMQGKVKTTQCDIASLHNLYIIKIRCYQMWFQDVYNIIFELKFAAASFRW